MGSERDVDTSDSQARATTPPSRPRRSTRKVVAPPGPVQPSRGPRSPVARRTGTISPASRRAGPRKPVTKTVTARRPAGPLPASARHRAGSLVAVSPTHTPRKKRPRRSTITRDGEGPEPPMSPSSRPPPAKRAKVEVLLTRMHFTASTASAAAKPPPRPRPKLQPGSVASMAQQSRARGLKPTPPAAKDGKQAARVQTARVLRPRSTART